MYEFLERRYALALYELGETNGKVESYLNEFREVSKLILGNDEIQQVVHHPKISTSRKKEIFSSIFSGQMSEDMLSFLLILIEKDRISDIGGILKQMELIHLEKNNTMEAVVKTVIPLDEDEKKALIQKLEAKYHKSILLKEEIDSSIIGGVYVRVGDDIIDGTVKNKLEEMKKNMLKGKIDVS